MHRYFDDWARIYLHLHLLMLRLLIPIGFSIDCRELWFINCYILLLLLLMLLLNSYCRHWRRWNRLPILDSLWFTIITVHHRRCWCLILMWCHLLFVHCWMHWLLLESIVVRRGCLVSHMILLSKWILLINVMIRHLRLLLGRSNSLRLI